MTQNKNQHTSMSLEKTNENLRKTLGHLYFSSIRLGRDYFDETIYEKEDIVNFDKVYYKFILGAAMKFDRPYGSIQFHEKNSILFDYAGFRFIIDETIIPFSLMTNTFGLSDEERIEKAKVKIRRSNGTIQDGLLDINDGLHVQFEKNRILIKVMFLEDENKPINYTITTRSDNSKYISINDNINILNKGVDLNDFIVINPDFKFNIIVESPLITNKQIYNEYILGDEYNENIYNGLNTYYKYELEKYFKKCSEQITNKNAFKYQVYTE